jgi:hypothetical protein
MPFYKKQVIHSEAGDPYLVRWSLDFGAFTVKLHHILRSDEDRDMHDHPWSFVSVILWGGYWEHRPDPWAHESEAGAAARHVSYRRWFGPGSVLRRPAPSIHRLELPLGKTAWSLVFTGRRLREWGFHTVCGWIPWRQYNDAKEEGC